MFDDIKKEIEELVKLYSGGLKSRDIVEELEKRGYDVSDISFLNLGIEVGIRLKKV